MYPLYRWTHDELAARLRELLDHGFHQEAVVASAQTLEQAFKRVLRSRMAETRRAVRRGEDNRLHVVPISTKADLEAGVRWELQSLQGIKVAWGKLMASTSTPRLPALVDATAGGGAWGSLSSRGPLQRLRTRDGEPVPFGVFHLRHRLVHGTNSPRSAVIEALAAEGARLTVDLLDPEKGIASNGVRDPLQRVFPFRKRASDSP